MTNERQYSPDSQAAPARTSTILGGLETAIDQDNPLRPVEKMRETPGGGRRCEDYSALARLGGLSCKDKYGREHFSKAGKKGGETTKKRGPEYYSMIGKQGNAAKRQMRLTSEGA
jgi:hypothetical protein